MQVAGEGSEQVLQCTARYLELMAGSKDADQCLLGLIERLIDLPVVTFFESGCGQRTSKSMLALYQLAALLL
ncbi:hypothetical protein D3C75_1189410 [compost metagenome]